MPTFYEELVTKLTNPMKQKPYKESSVKPLFAYLKKLNGNAVPTSLDFLLERSIVLPFLQTYAVNTQRSIVFAIRNIAKDFGREDVLEVWKDNIDETEAGKGLPEVGSYTEAQQKTYAKLEKDKDGDAWNVVLKMVEKINTKADESKKYGDLQYVVANIYTMFPPRRNIDYTEMKITTDYKSTMSKDFNYLVIGVEGDKTAMRYVFNRYKTDGVYHQQVFDVPEDLVEVLKRWISANEKKDGDFLLTKVGRYTHKGSEGVKLESSDMVDVLNRVFEKGLSTQMLRHLYCEKYNTCDKKGIISEMMGDAEKMSHSISTQQQTYVKKKIIKIRVPKE